VTTQTDLDFDGSFERIERMHRDGDLVIQVDPPRDGERLIHVISRRAGGEIRGYRLCERGCAHVRLPAYEGHWPEIDALVARVVGCTVVGLDQGGVYTGQVIHPIEKCRAGGAS
jgi:hypothetical protein